MKARPHDVHDTSGSSADLRAQLEQAQRERDNAWDKYAEVCQEKADLERELHEARESFTDYAEEMGQENERLRALGKEITHDAQTLSQNNMDLRQRLAQAEKVIEAAKPVLKDLEAAVDTLVDCGEVHSRDIGRAIRDRLSAALAEWEGK